MRKGFLRELLFTGFLILLGSIEAISGTPTPHLQPEDGFFGFTMLNPYYEAVSDRLQLTSTFRKCQAVFLPSFSEESAVYLIYNHTIDPHVGNC